MLDDVEVSERPAPAPDLPEAKAPQGSDRRCRLARGGEYLSFRVGEEEYALDILKVQEIRSYEPPTRIAGVPDCIKGVVNLRGVIVPIVDMRLTLGVQAPGYDALTVVIVLNVFKRVVGVVVDSVSDVVELPAALIRPAPDMQRAGPTDFISGLASLDRPGIDGAAARKRLLILADVERLLGAAAIGLVGADLQLH